MMKRWNVNELRQLSLLQRELELDKISFVKYHKALSVLYGVN